jgi:hypothetical protein
MPSTSFWLWLFVVILLVIVGGAVLFGGVFQP